MKPSPKPTPVEETVARYQLTAEKQIADLASELRQAIGEMRTKLGELADWRLGVGEELKGMSTSIKNHAHTMDQGLKEANVALRVAVEQTEKAREHLAVYERAREEAPDLAGSIGDIARKLGRVEDAFAEIRESHAALTVKFDSVDFETIAGDMYEESEETEGTSTAQAILRRDQETARENAKTQAASR